jgi:peptidoglycan/xylan/chitin deacetylase (PgdA/CDA1 family)
MKPFAHHTKTNRAPSEKDDCAGRNVGVTLWAGRNVGVTVVERALAILAGIALSTSVAHPEILGPYTPDPDTLHLWHMNESTPPVVDAAANGTDLTALENGATLGNESYPGMKGFGTALGTYTGNPATRPGSAGQDGYLSALPLQNGAADNVTISYAGSSDAFTYEAMIRIDFNPTVTFGADGWGQGRNLFMQIINGDADENANRVFQFRLAPIGTLNGNSSVLVEFINVNKGVSPQSLTAAIPTEGPDAIREGAWYHVAVTYNGHPDQPDNLKLYWTSLDPSRVVASQIGTGQMTQSLPSGCAPDFAIGQAGRQSPVATSPNNNFVGLIDEVRISGIARSENEMLFGVPGAIAAKSAKPAPVAALGGSSISPSAPVSKTTTIANPAMVATTFVFGAPVIATPAESARPGAQERPGVTTAAAKHSIETTPVRAPARTDMGAALSVVNGAIVRGPQNRPRIALLFSCRDVDEGSGVIMQTLREHHAKASFFVSSDFLSWPVNTGFIRAAYREGHFVGPQSDDWIEFTKVGRRTTTYASVEEHLNLLGQVGVLRHEMRFFLPTSDQLNSTVVEHGRDYGMSMITGTPGTLSLKTKTQDNTKEFTSSQRILESILARERSGNNGLNGFQLLFQLESGERQTDKFYARFAELLDTLQKRGYEFVRLDELLKVESVNWALVQP